MYANLYEHKLSCIEFTQSPDLKQDGSYEQFVFIFWQKLRYSNYCKLPTIHYVVLVHIWHTVQKSYQK